MRARSSFAVLALVGIAVSPVPGVGQAIDIAPTYQASVATGFAELPSSQFQAAGVMVGFQQSGAWSPHVWVQRYRLDSDCQASVPARDDCRTSGWTVSVGPALKFIDTERVVGRFVTQVGLDSRSSFDFTGGGGLHVGVRLGVFEPQAFSRFDVFRGIGYTTVGVGLRFRISDGPTYGDPQWER